LHRFTHFQIIEFTKIDVSHIKEDEKWVKKGDDILIEQCFIITTKNLNGAITKIISIKHICTCNNTYHILFFFTNEYL